MGEIQDVNEVLLPGLHEVLDLAQSKGIHLALENIISWIGEEEDRYFSDPLNMLRFLTDLGHPNLKVTFDLPHTQRWGNAKKYIQMLGEQIVNVHLADYTSDFRRVPLGEGEIDWEDALSHLKRMPNLRQVTLELSGAEPEDVRQSLESIQKCWQKAVG